MILKDVVQWLLSESYAVIVQGQLVITQKCQSEITSLIAPPIEQVLPTVAPKKVTRPPVDVRAIWDKFMEDADIPHRVTAHNGGQYTVKQYSRPAAARLAQIVNDKTIDYKILVESTKNYYKTVTFKQTIGNYIEQEVWRYEYLEWQKKGNKKPHVPGENRFEI